VKLIYRPLFLADVEQCADYLAMEANETVAAAWYQALKKSLQHIQDAPEIGRVRQDLPVPEIRLIFYRLENDAIELLRVRHGMMNLPELFAE